MQRALRVLRVAGVGLVVAVLVSAIPWPLGFVVVVEYALFSLVFLSAVVVVGGFMGGAAYEDRWMFLFSLIALVVMLACFGLGWLLLE